MEHDAQTREAELVGAREVVAVFPSNGALVNAVETLELHGIDRARLSVLSAGTDEHDKALRAAGFKTVRDLLDAPDVPRTAYMDPGDIAAVKGAVVSGLVFVAATLGVAVTSALAPFIAPMAASAFAGGSAGAALAAFIDYRFGGQYARYVNESLEHGGLVLWVRVREPEEEQEIISLLKQSRGQEVRAQDIPGYPLG